MLVRCPPPKVEPRLISFVQLSQINLAMNSHIPAGYAAVGDTLNATPSAVLPIIRSLWPECPHDFGSGPV